MYQQGEPVIYVDHEGNPRGALVLVPNNQTEHHLIVKVADTATPPVLDNADYHMGLERKFNVEDVWHRIARLKAERQKLADDTLLATPPLMYGDLTETIVRVGVDVKLAVDMFQPSREAIEAAEAKKKGSEIPAQVAGDGTKGGPHDPTVNTSQTAEVVDPDTVHDSDGEASLGKTEEPTS